MKVRIALLVLAFCASASFATESVKKAPSPAQQAQQEKMKACNANAGTQALKGEERKKFMRECLSKNAAVAPETPAAAPETQQGKMKACNADATQKQLKGKERKAFMSECLKAEKK